MKIIINLLLAGLVAGLIFSACQDYYDDGGTLSAEPMKINSLEFIKSRPDLFDTTLILLEKTGLDKVVAEKDITFFAPHKKSIAALMIKVNTFVKKKRDSLGYDKDTVLLDDVPAEVWEKYMSRYIFKGVKLRDGITKGKFLSENNKNWIVGGEHADSYGNYNMFMMTEWTKWETVEEAGPKYIYLIDTFGTDVTIPGSTAYTSVKVVTSNLQTTSGVVHVLARTHEFGFNNSTKFIPAK